VREEITLALDFEPADFEPADLEPADFKAAMTFTWFDLERWLLGMTTI